MSYTDAPGQNYGKAPVWAAVCIKLLQGPVYRTNNADPAWATLQAWQSEIDRYFWTIGLHVFVDAADGYAFLEQREMGEEEEPLPRLIQERQLTMQDSLLCVLFREALDQFDSSQDQSENLLLSRSEIEERMSSFFPEKKDQTKSLRKLDESLNRLCALSFIREIESTSSFDRTFEVRRIIKAKINAEFITEFRDKLSKILGKENGGRE